MPDFLDSFLDFYFPYLILDFNDTPFRQFLKLAFIDALNAIKSIL